MGKNLEKVKAAYQAWNDSKGASVDTWRALMADKVTLTSVDETTPGLAFAKNRVSREDAVAYLSGITEGWSMVHFSPQFFLEDGDQVAMFGTCAWVNKATGKEAKTMIASHLLFEDGEVMSITDLFDTAAAGRAATPD